MAKSIAAWQAEDGSIHPTESDAKAHDFDKAFRAWAYPALGDIIDGNDVVLDATISKIIECRMELLAIWKILNGGNPITAPSLATETET